MDEHRRTHTHKNVAKVNDIRRRETFIVKEVWTLLGSKGTLFLGKAMGTPVQLFVTVFSLPRLRLASRFPHVTDLLCWALRSFMVQSTQLSSAQLSSGWFMVQSTLLVLLLLLLSLHGSDAKPHNSSCAATTAVGSAPACTHLLIYESSSFCCPGLGAQVNNMLVAFAVALASGREFVWHSDVSSFGCPPGRGGRASPGGLDSRDCLFAPSRCEQAAATALRARGTNVKDCASRDEGGDCAEFVSREATPATRARLFELEDEVLFASQYVRSLATN